MKTNVFIMRTMQWTLNQFNFQFFTEIKKKCFVADLQLIRCPFSNLLSCRLCVFQIENMHLCTDRQCSPVTAAAGTHCYFTRLNLKKWGHSNFAFQYFQVFIYTQCQGFLRAALTIAVSFRTRVEIRTTNCGQNQDNLTAS